jgi:hypothetical protein
MIIYFTDYFNVRISGWQAKIDYFTELATQLISDRKNRLANFNTECMGFLRYICFSN